MPGESYTLARFVILSDRFCYRKTATRRVTKHSDSTVRVDYQHVGVI